MSENQYSPADETVIWRYMKLNSFLELLSGRLVQTRIDTLHDEAEGAFGWRNVHFAPAVLQKLGLSRDGNGHAAIHSDDVIRRARTFVAASYWFEFDRESYGMWNVYGRSGESVAIETTVGALRALLNRNGDARVERMRYEPMEGEIGDVHTLFFHKRREYRYEREIRSVQVFSEPMRGPIVDQRLSLDDLNVLVKRIVLAPYSRKTFVAAVEHIVESVFAFEDKRFTGEICKSVLDEDLVPQ